MQLKLAQPFFVLVPARIVQECGIYRTLDLAIIGLLI